MKVLVICSGNICRSPMAAEYLRSRAALSGLAHVVIDSAGTLGIDGAPASSEAIAVMRAAGLDLSTHRSRGLTQADLRSSDLVVAMSGDHLEHLAATHPEGSEKRVLLRAFEKGSEPMDHAADLADPITKPIEFYREQFELIRNCVDQLILYLKHRAVRPEDG